MKIVLVVIAVVLVVLGGYSVWALTHPTTLRTEIEIPASPDAVWDVADRDAYAEWNPFIRSSTGDLVVGRRIANVLKDGAGKESTFEPKLLVVEPGRELRWIGKVGFGGSSTASTRSDRAGRTGPGPLHPGGEVPRCRGARHARLAERQDQAPVRRHEHRAGDPRAVPLNHLPYRHAAAVASWRRVGTGGRPGSRCA